MTISPKDIAFAAAGDQLSGKDLAFIIAKKTAEQPREARRWPGQNAWDLENMVTESTRFTAKEDQKLCAALDEAHINKYQLIGYMLRMWLLFWPTYRKKEGTNNE